ncbi:MAG: peptidoglycan D,D-transpeptidase FtsI family protein [Candidatus Limnocylindrales bacterium]
MLGRTDRRLRLVALLAAFLVMAGALAVRHAYWAVARSGELADKAAAQLEATESLPVQRGGIYDRKGSLLATTAYRDRLVAFPAQIPQGQGSPMATRLAAILDLDADATDRLRTTLTGAAAYSVLASGLTEAQSAAIRAGLGDDTLAQLELDPEPVRVYPDPGGAPSTTLASQLLGFVNAAGAGQYGVEQHYDDALAGRPEVVSGLRDAAGRPMADSQTVVDPGQPGVDLRLTIDASLQLQLEKELYAARVADKAASASAVILDPQTGAVLAWASVPGYDANDYQAIAAADPGRFVDPLVSTVYEPGSVMKMFVATAAYRKGTVTAATKVNDSGTLRLGRNRVFDADKRAMGWIRFEDGIAYSRNVVAAKTAFGLAKGTAAASRTLYAAWHDLGIGVKTGVDVAGEVAGLVADPAVQPWADIDLANRSFGQGVAVTPLQLASAYCTMINGGFRVTPHVVAAVAGQDIQLAQRQQVLSSGLSGQLRQLMVHVLTSVPWYNAGTVMPGYVVGGKTGTAQIWDSKANDWVPDTYNFSFVGFVGRDAPAAVVAVRLDHVKPKVVRQGTLQLAITSYELFRRIAGDTVAALDLAPATGAPAAVSSEVPAGAPEVPDLPAPSLRP